MESDCFLLGGEFEDSVFEQRLERPRKPLAPYRAKCCEPQWFLEELGSSDEADNLTVKKFRGDLAYRRQEYQKALQEYSSIVEQLPSTNFAMRRDIQEGQARCLTQLGRHAEALEVAAELENKAANTDHLTTVLSLQFAICSSLHDTEKAILCLQKLISLHPFNPWNWGKLAEAYLTLRPALSASSASCQRQGEFTSSDQAVTSSSPHSAKGCLSCPPAGLPASSVLSGGASRGGCQRPAQALESKQNGVAADRGAILPQIQLIAADRGAILPETQLIAADRAAILPETQLKACASFVRTRLLLQLAQAQQTSFALERNIRTQQEIEDKMKEFGLEEGPLLWLEEVMGEDIVPEKLHDEVHAEVKCVGPAALAAMVIASSKEFEDKWFGKIKDRFCPFENPFHPEIRISAVEALQK